MRKLKRSTVVITGATSGVGRACALQFADKGAALMLAARRADALDEIVRECRDRGAQAHGVALDVRDESAMLELARETVSRHGRIDVWVNAASANAYGRIEELPSEWWRAVIDTNLTGYFLGLQAAIPWMRDQGRGTIINIGSILDTTVVPYQAAYIASKHGVRALTDSARQETSDVKGIRLCLISPGAIDTPFIANAANVTGRRIEPPVRVLDARAVAAKVVSCTRRPRDDIFVGPDNVSVMLSERVAPGLTRRLMTVLGNHDQFGDEPQARTSGSLLEPQPDVPARIDGGWRGHGTKNHRRKRGALLGLGALAAGGFWLARAPRA
ncbi:SDR family NAD(P)-dependent oxidoreductase [Demequina sp. SO4-13]|uniref:SDR family NAD(P)-dependent oxidoreductase n=1 Tax=Demequina sp. SO4-13 TaxID=3401027 RepID=UPI003AF790B2